MCMSGEVVTLENRIPNVPFKVWNKKFHGTKGYIFSEYFRFKIDLKISSFRLSNL